MITVDLNGKVALICGAGGGGIGSAVSRCIAAAGATVAAVGTVDDGDGDCVHVVTP